MKKIYSIELLRFFSISLVLLWHYKFFFFVSNKYYKFNIETEKILLPFYNILKKFYNAGYYGVELFWCISGFIISYIYLSYSKKVSAKKYFINRFSRLYPLHLLTLIIVLILQIISKVLTNNFQVFFGNDFYHFILNLLFISGWGFEKTSSFNQPIWSVSIEIIIYIYFYLLINFIKKYKYIFLMLLYLILFLFNKFIFPNSILNAGAFFVSGILVYFLFFEKRKIFHYLLIILFFINISGNFKINAFCPFMIMLCLLSEKYINKNTKNIFSFFGNLTYSAFLLHFPLTLIILIMQGVLNFSSDIYFTYKFFFLYFVILIILSHLSFIYFEMKIKNKIRNLMLKKI
jgi:peptidoglycan/LPS O-acetylase OafA/YrhL